MSDKQVFRLVHPTARQMASRAVINAPDGFICEVKPATRSLDQNAMLHAIFSDVAQQATFHGKPRSAQQWKVIFISAHSVATNEGAEIVPGLEGEFVNIRESSARMSVKRLNSLIEYVQAWCAENGIRLTEMAAKGYEEMQCA
jgi:NinB protein